MRRRSGSGDKRIERAKEAADQIFNDPKASPGPSFVPNNTEEARAAVERLGELFEGLPETAKIAFDGARKSGILLSGKSLQGLAEIVQNADDAEASEVHFLLRPSELLATHNGLPVHLRDVHGLATPWLSTKADDASTIGRFGIGLYTLQALSPTFEVHCAPYHVRVGDPTVAPVGPAEMPPRFCEPGWTTLLIPLQDGVLRLEQLEEWFDDRWDDSSLLFLRHVARVTLLESNGSSIRELALSRYRDEDLTLKLGTSAIWRESATTADGRSWALYGTEVPKPKDVERARKATGATTPIAVAFPLGPTEAGQIYAGLPVAPTSQPLFANAQFDPLTSRTDFGETSWNKALPILVADVWTEAVLDLFARDPQAAWQAIPLPRDEDGASEVVQSLESAVVEKARQAVASRLSFPVHGQGHVSLSQLAVEAQPLEGVLSNAETARLAGLGAALPVALRDPNGRWRLVLDDWRSHGADLPEEVSVERALDLVGDDGRTVSSTIALVAAALKEGLGSILLELPCVIALDGRRLIPPDADSTEAVSTHRSPLTEHLGITTLLHSEYLANTNGAPEILDWLEDCGALLDVSDDGEVLRRIARAGRSGNTIKSPLADEQVRALRDAFEHIDQDEAQNLGPDVGRAIRLKSYMYNAEGRKTRDTARPADTYVPLAITRESIGFAVAADKTQGLMWLSDHYAKALRSDAGRDGIGALSLLRLLGAETVPRPQLHAEHETPYMWSNRRDKRPGLPQGVAGGTEARSMAMRHLRATHTLEDYDCPDLRAVAIDISEERQGERRRKRAGALLAALDRAWDRHLSDYAEVEAARKDLRWHTRGRIGAFWLWQVKDIEWLDDASGTARKPAELRLRTPGTEAIFGKNSPDYLHADLVQEKRHDLLVKLGVSSDPSRFDLVERLRKIKIDSSEVETPPEILRQDSALVYRALAQSLKSKPINSTDLNEDQLREEFARSHLVFTNLDWQPPQSVLTGTPIFKNLRAFAPAPKKYKPLWDALRLRSPSQHDCLGVLKEIASDREDAPDEAEEAILLDTLRALSKHCEDGATVASREAKNLALWTSKGWAHDRPVYATDDPVLADGLGDHIQIWKPGGGLEQFRPLLEPLGITEIQASETRVIGPEHAFEDPDRTELFQKAVELLRDDLIRNDEQLAKGLTVPWESLAMCTVKVHPSLALAVSVAQDQEYECVANAKIDIKHATAYVSAPTMLTRESGGGRALAALFEGDARRIAQAWLAACEGTVEGIEAQAIELAYERVEPEDVELRDDNRLAELQAQISQKQDSPQEPASRRAVGGTHPPYTVTHKPEQKKQPPSLTAPRKLVDPQSLTPVDPDGRLVQGTPSTASNIGESPSRVGSLREPRSGTSGPSNMTPLRGYSDIDRENVGFELFVRAVGTDQNKITDLRSQRGVGADAVDEEGRFYELKVYANSEPDEVTLTASEVRRAHATPDFFLVVISNVEEGADGPAIVRIVANPLEELHPTDRGTITLSGLHKLDMLVHKFVQTDAQ